MSADEDIANQIGACLAIALVAVVLLVVLGVYAWHHFRFV
jgi:hypothetical protein